MLRYVKVEFHRFKAFESFSISLKHFNIIVGPNNAGKSTILAAFRILAAGLRKANSQRPTIVRFNNASVRGYILDLESISIAQENIFFNYDDDSAAWVRFTLSNKSTLTLYFPEREVCFLIPEGAGKAIETPSAFRTRFNCPIGFVPILGPVDHNEPLFAKEAARQALFNYRAAKNFRNIWYHYPERFEEFQNLLKQTWPGMDILPPEIDRSYQKPQLRMFCPEHRKPRELFWAGFGFQVWCQMLTHIIQRVNSSIFLIDEPDIYLHSELQRQLLGILRAMGPDILIATHSSEIISEADSDEILLISKGRRAAKRLHDTTQLAGVLKTLGSNMNPLLTQLAKTRRALFVEGKDFQVIGRFAQKIAATGVGNRRDFAVIPVEGFNPERIKSLISGIEATLGSAIRSAVVLDGDFRCDDEKEQIKESCEKFSNYVAIHSRNEIENFLLVPDAIDRALKSRVEDRDRRAGNGEPFAPLAVAAMQRYADTAKIEVQSRLIADRKDFERKKGSKVHDAGINASALKDFERRWNTNEGRLALLPGKETLAAINKEAQEKFSVSLTPTAIIDAMHVAEVPPEMIQLIEMLKSLSVSNPDDLLPGTLTAIPA